MPISAGGTADLIVSNGQLIGDVTM